MPGIIPRLKDFAQNGFGWLAYLMAYLYVGVRLLPPNHPYFKASNFGRYGVRHVIAEAANRLVFKRENIDQIAVFFVVLMAFVLLVLQFAVVVLTVIFHPAHAAAAPAFTGFFQTPNPTNDIALELLDKVFAVPGLFKSQFDPASGGIPPFNAGLQKLIQFYNYAMLLVGVAIFIYYIIAVVAETASTGTPFGRRFSNIYAPLRLVVAVGALVPLNYGYNGAQYIALYAAKYGSGLATNTWIVFNKAITGAAAGNGSTSTNNPLATPNETLIARPQMPDVGDVVQFMSLVKACALGYDEEYIAPPYSTPDTQETTDIEPYLVWGTTQSAKLIGTDYNTAAGASEFNGHDITVRFGQLSQKTYPNERNYVYPFCGEITIHVSNMPGSSTEQTNGPDLIQTAYYQLIQNLWSSTEVQEFAQRATAIYLIRDPNKGNPSNVTVSADGGGGTFSGTTSTASDTSSGLPGEAVRQQMVADENAFIQGEATTARDQMISAADFTIPQQLIDSGWGGAAIWYNRIAMWNGALFGSVFNTPTASMMPSAMERTEHERRINDQNVDADNRFEPYIKDGQVVGIDQGEIEVARMMNAVYKYWRVDNPTSALTAHTTGNVFMDMINFIFPYDALMQIPYNIDVNPLAQLSGLGKGIIDSAVRNLTVGLAFAAGGGMATAMQSQMGATLTFAAQAWISLTTASLTIGFILYYVLPFMPFMYFFFAVGSWVKSIFEAMVGVPLWALAHLRIDGPGLPGPSGIDGYFLIFEIFARPIFTLFGLLGGMVIFSALARELHDVFGIVVSNVAGFDQHRVAVADGATGGQGNVGGIAGADYTVQNAQQAGPLDEFFYTVIYTIILYSLATSSFKMIDQVPQGVMRWMGTTAQSFADDRADPVSGLSGYAAIGGARVAGQAMEGLTGAANTAGGFLGGSMRSMTGRNANKLTGTKT